MFDTLRVKDKKYPRAGVPRFTQPGVDQAVQQRLENPDLRTHGARVGHPHAY